MSKVFDFIDFITSLFEKFFDFIGTMWNVVSSFQSLVNSFLLDCPPVLSTFFGLFLTISIVLFVWRLIP